MQKPDLLAALVSLSLVCGPVISARHDHENPCEGKAAVQKDMPTVKNPAKPPYGEISLELEKDLVLGSDKDEHRIFYRVWDIQADNQGNIYVLDSGAHRVQKYDKTGKYLQSIGRQGQGPGEFERPIMLALDKKDGLYVGEMAKIHCFDPYGEFVKTTKISFFFMDFAPDGEGNFGLTGRVTAERSQNLCVTILNTDGEIVEKIAEFPGLPVHETGTTVAHDYSPGLRFAAFGNRGFIYGYNLEYKLYAVDWSGTPFLVFEKEESLHPISRSEKNKIIEDLAKNSANAELKWSKSVLEKMANMPKHRPFFDRIKVDDTGRIYVRQRRSILEDNRDMLYDIFGSDGQYLFITKLPFEPMCIKTGFLCHTSYSEETGEVKVTRHRIKNWGQLPKSRN